MDSFYSVECNDSDVYNQSISSMTMDLASREASRFAMLFYLAKPSETSHQRVENMPDYFVHVAPTVITLMLTEIVVRYFMTIENIRMNDFLGSITSSVVYAAACGPSRIIEVYLYQSVYDKRLFTFDWDSTLTWWVAALAVDFLFYWFHRFAHETNVGWAGHQVHHGSEDYNLAASVRQSAILKMYTLLFYLPMAYMGIPLTATLVHMQLNIIYQFWLHTELVSTVGPLEWIFNTPSHHRVHHGSEPWCLDKNYGGVLIIWDRLFGTFQEEIKDKKIIYGLVDQPFSVNAIYLETFYFGKVYTKFMEQKTLTNKFKALFYGPGWTPGAPRLGHPLPEPPADQPPRKKYDPQLPLLLEVYLALHFGIGALVQKAVMDHFSKMPGISSLVNTLFALATMGAIGGMYDGWSGVMKLEVFRCASYLVYSTYFSVFDNVWIDAAVQAYLAFSVVLWSVHSISKTTYYSWRKKVQ